MAHSLNVAGGHLVLNLSTHVSLKELEIRGQTRKNTKEVNMLQFEEGSQPKLSGLEEKHDGKQL